MVETLIENLFQSFFFWAVIIIRRIVQIIIIVHKKKGEYGDLFTKCCENTSNRWETIEIMEKLFIADHSKQFRR